MDGSSCLRHYDTLRTKIDVTHTNKNVPEKLAVILMKHYLMLDKTLAGLFENHVLF